MGLIPSKELRLMNEILRHNALYDAGKPEIEDAAYDALRDELRAINPESPALKTGHLDRNSMLKKVKHEIHMGSISNSNKFDPKGDYGQGFLNWWKERVTNGQGAYGNLKVDGFSVMLKYEKGELVMATTRGDYEEGLDITANAKLMRDVPHVLPDMFVAPNVRGPVPFTGYVRGEAVMMAIDWVKFRAHNPEYKNPRNATAGIARRLDGEGCNVLRFIAHNLVCKEEGHGPAEFSLKMDLLKVVGFKIPEGYLFQSPGAAAEWYQKVVDNRKGSLPYEIDGIVFTVNDVEHLNKLGIDSDECPRGQVAWKFPAETALTTLNAVDWQVDGHTGKLNPVARLQPVDLLGVTISNATLCNPEEIRRLGVMIGDRVSISRRGDVIPKVEQVVYMGEGRVPIDIPWRCPTCEGNVDRKRLSSKKKTAKVMDDLYSADIFCLNPECPGKAVGSIMKWVKETKMLGIADGIIGVLYDRGVIKTAADLYRLTLDDLTALPFGNGIFGYPRAKKMLEVIKSRRQVSLPVFLAGLAVPGLGDTKVRDIQTKWRAIRGNSVGKPDHFDHLHSWFSGEGIPTLLIGFAPELGIPNTAKALQAGLDAREGIATALITNGVEIVPETQPEAKEGPLKGVVVCFTGKLPNKESHYADLVRQAGGAVEDDLKSNVTHLVTGDPSKETGKTKKAKAKGIPVWSIDELQARMSPPRQQLTITQPWPENEAAHIEKAHNPELVEDPEGYSG